MIGWVGAKGISFVSRGARIEAPVGDFLPERRLKGLPSDYRIVAVDGT